MTTAINRALMQITKRAETGDIDTLMSTFVDVGPLLTLLATLDHQILYGRRGTGKTHALIYLARQVEESKDWGIYIDLRQIGSSGGIYSDGSIPIAERGTRLLLDVLAAVQSELVDRVLVAAEEDTFDFSLAMDSLDNLADEISQVQVKGTVETASTVSGESSSKSHTAAGLSKRGPELSLASDSSAQVSAARTVTRSGTEEHYVRFGGLANHFESLLGSLPNRRIWILLDEWSTIPLELQPLLADLCRRSLFPVSGLTVKIAAIEHRSRFSITREQGDYLGIELGADASANVDLDDFMVFGNNADQAETFFRELIFRHVAAVMSSERFQGEPPPDTQRFIAEAFTQSNTFDELVRAAEGVPRDAINVIALAAQLAADERISMNHVRDAARRWYQPDKESALDPKGISDKNVRSLYDARVLHLLRRGISSRIGLGSDSTRMLWTSGTMCISPQLSAAWPF